MNKKELLTKFEESVEQDDFQYYIDVVYANNPFKQRTSLSKNLNVYYFVENFFRESDEYGITEDASVRATEKLLFRSLLLYLIEYCPKHQQEFSSVAKLLRSAKGSKCNPDAETTLDKIYEELSERYPKSVSLNQYCAAKINSASRFNDAVTMLLNRITILELLEKEISESK